MLKCECMMSPFTTTFSNQKISLWQSAALTRVTRKVV